jgi:DNA-binding NarL/FixJ family response regulator
MTNPDTPNRPEIITFVLVDDNRAFQGALAHFFGEMPSLSLVGVASSGQEALELPDSSNPDIVLLDLHLPDRFGLALFAPLRAKWPRTQVIVLTFADQPRFRAAALAAGATDFVSKISAADELLPAMLKAMKNSRSDSGGTP